MTNAHFYQKKNLVDALKRNPIFVQAKKKAFIKIC